MPVNGDAILDLIKAKLDVYSMRLGEVVRVLPIGFSSCTQNSVSAAIVYLREVEIGIYPTDPPVDRDFVVRLYKLNSPVAELISAVLQPSEESDKLVRSGAKFNLALDEFVDATYG